MRSDDDAMVRFGLVPSVDGAALADMTATDCWAWHRRPLASRARVAAARHAVALMGAYDTVLDAINAAAGRPLHAGSFKRSLNNKPQEYVDDELDAEHIDHP